ncbi:Putative serine hydrolase FSH, alpha/Beta hydrolase [Colletotrichum destructivum]|uniref:Serine hydrolase FSH, alpha/Beta hydrolase n=1 Tax=Colletotrichum destructivum TaxID=34406 RepID=A0AAX4IRY5_9PEZI|nr:Putative serine hydrolase FSH, alpha/Beta hydrolase [Colletotrichum destructivum]
MRFLALHGVGSSANILESQLAGLMSSVDASYEFVLVDGHAPSHRGPGMSPALSGPFYSHTTGYTPAEIQAAHNEIAATVAELGPFDGILGFSQGASLALSYIYHQQVSGEELDFKFAVLFSSVVPFSADSTYCENEIEELCSYRRTGMIIKDLAPRQQVFNDCLVRTFQSALKIGAVLPDFNQDFFRDDGKAVPRVLHPLLLSERIRIPTVHVSGRRDFPFMHDMHEVGYQMCDPRLSKKLYHSGGHHPPKKDSEIKAVVRAIEWAVDQYYRQPPSFL